MAFLRRSKYVATGSQTEFDVSFPLAPKLGRTAVAVFVYGPSSNPGPAKTLGTDYEWLSDGMVSFFVPPTAGLIVDIRGITNVDDLDNTIQAGGSLKSLELVQNDTQLLYLLQEGKDDTGDLQDQIQTTVRGPLGEVLAHLPPASARQGRFLAFDAGGSPIPAAGTGADSALRADLASSGGAALISLMPQGAVGNTSADDSLAIYNLIVAKAGNRADLPVGQFRADVPRTFPGLSHIYGAGSGEGPGTFSGDRCTQIIANFSDGHVWDFAPSVFGSTIEGVQFNAYNQRTSGAALHLKGTGVVTGAGPYTVTGSVVSGHKVRDCAFNSQAIDILLDVAGWGDIYRNYHQTWKTNAIETDGDGPGIDYLGVSVGNESTGGWISKQFFFGDTSAGTTQNACFKPRCGYYKFTENHCLGAKYGVDMDVSEYPAGAPEIRATVFEEQDVASIRLKNGNAEKASMVKIHDNECSIASLGAGARVNFVGHIVVEAGSASWIEEMTVLNNVMRTAVAAASAAFVDIQTGDEVTISANRLQGLTGNTTKGIRVGAQVTSASVLDNVVRGNFGAKYTLTANCLLRDFGSGLTVAEVNAITCADQSIVKVVDGDPTNPTLTGGSTGCIAVRRGGVWAPIMTLHGSVAGYGTPTGGARLANFPGASATLAQTSAAVAQLILDLKGRGELST